VCSAHPVPGDGRAGGPPRCWLGASLSPWPVLVLGAGPPISADGASRGSKLRSFMASDGLRAGEGLTAYASRDHRRLANGLLTESLIRSETLVDRTDCSNANPQVSGYVAPPADTGHHGKMRLENLWA
jgi:hypothetical protein